MQKDRNSFAQLFTVSCIYVESSMYTYVNHGTQTYTRTLTILYANIYGNLYVFASVCMYTFQRIYFTFNLNNWKRCYSVNTNTYEVCIFSRFFLFVCVVFLFWIHIPLNIQFDPPHGVFPANLSLSYWGVEQRFEASKRLQTRKSES